MTAVAVVKKRPTHEELLSMLIERGWRPTPTETREGPKILGFAAGWKKADPT